MYEKFIILSHDSKEDGSDGHTDYTIQYNKIQFL